MLIRKSASVSVVDAKVLSVVVPPSRVARQGRVTVRIGHQERVTVDRLTGPRVTAHQETGIRWRETVLLVMPTPAKEIVLQLLLTVPQPLLTVLVPVPRVVELPIGVDKLVITPVIGQVVVVTGRVVVVGEAIRPTGVRAVVVKHRRRPMFANLSSRPMLVCRVIPPIGVPTVGAIVEASGRKTAG
jgi:hypothetical protein